MDLTPLRINQGYWYCGSPYSLFPDGIDRACDIACKATAFLISHGIPVFSPIAHAHSIALRGGIDPLDHEMWMPADRPLMDAAHGLIVLTMQGWERSRGLSEELHIFRTAEKPIEYLSPMELT